MKIKVCLIGDNGSVHIQKWISALASHPKVELEVISFEKGLLIKNVTYHFIKQYTKTKLDYILNLQKVKSIIKKIKPDILHAHYATSYGFIGAYSGFHPFVLTGWGADIFDSPTNPLMKLLLQYSLSKADAISVLSKITLIEIKKFTSKQVHLIPFGVNTDLFVSNKSKQSNEIRIGTIRTLSEKYGIEYLIRAFAILEKKCPNIYLDIVGLGPLLDELKNLTIELNINEKVKFFGYVNQNSDFDRYLQILQNFDIFVIPSIIDSETFGVAAVEAASCSIPVVATNVGGLPEVVLDRKTGIIVEPQNSVAIALALKELITDSSLRVNLGKNGRDNAVSRFSWTQNVNQMVDLYYSEYKNKKQ